MVDKKPVGKVTHFFPKVSVAVVKLTDNLKVGDSITIEGHDKVLEQPVESMQVNHEDILEAKPGDDVGLKTHDPVKQGDVVYLIVE